MIVERRLSLVGELKLEEKIITAQIDQVYQSAPVVHIVTIFVALMTVITLWGRVTMTALLTWGLAMLLVSLVRLYIALLYRRNREARSTLFWERAFLNGTLITGLLLGSSAGFMLLNHDLTQHFVLLVISVGMLAGAVSSLSPHLRSFRRLFFAVTLPYLSVLLFEGVISSEHGQLMFNLGLLYVAFTVALYTFAATGHRRLTQGLHHQFANQMLVDNLHKEAKLREEMQDELMLAERIITNVKEGIIVTDSQNRVVRINEKFSRITGYSQDEVLGKGPNLLSSGKQDRQFYTHMWQALGAFGEWEGEIWNRRKNGEIYPEWLSISVIKDSTGKVSHYVGWFRDITERKREEERLAYLANYDVLTGLPNRKMFIEQLDTELADCQERNTLLGLMFIDLNLFKTVNDNFGHDVGDVLLKQVAMRIGSVIRSEDTVARLGGDEFVVLLRDLRDASDAELVAEKLIATIEAPFYINQNECKVGFAIGISLAPVHSVERRELLHLSDRAMYMAKQDRSRSHWYMSQGGESVDDKAS